MACFGLVTFFPLRPDFSFPCFISRISRSTALPAAGLYLRELDDFFEEDFLDALFFFEDEDFFAEDFLADVFLDDDEDFLEDEDFFAGLFFEALFFFVAIVIPPRSMGRAAKRRGCRVEQPLYEAEAVTHYCVSDAMSITKRYFTSDLSTRSKASLIF